MATRPLRPRPANRLRPRTLAALGFALACGVVPVRAAPPTGAPPPTGLPAAPTLAATPAAAPGAAPLGCVIEPAATAEVGAAVPGVLDTVRVERGATVRRGQVLATLQADVERAAAEAARARAGADGEIAALATARDLARLRMKRLHALTELQFGGRLELETAAAEFEIADHRLQQARDARAIAERELDLAQRQIELRTVRSPIDGVVADRLLHPGERVDGRPILRLVALDRLRVEVVVPASRFGQIREGGRASVRPELPGAPEVAGRVEQVDRFVDAASGTFRARVALVNRDGRVPAGVRCQVAFDAPDAPLARPAGHGAPGGPAAGSGGRSQARAARS
jgi:RND family efflux transporter MFP subunit